MRLLGSLACSAAMLAAAPSPAQIREAASRAIARLQQSQKTWYRDETCASCHHQFLPALAYRSAREHGIHLDERVARADAVRAFQPLGDLNLALEQTRNFDPGIGGSLSLVAANAAGVQANLATAAYARFLMLRQKPAGNWVSFDERPPQSYSVFSATALSLRAIDLYSHPKLRSQATASLARARAWLEAHEPANTEDRAFQVMGLLWARADRATIDRATQALLHTQQPDGGWNSLDGRPSDAYSTGQALVTLADAGVPAHGGLEFLLKTQARDGTWHVATRLHPPAPLSPDYFESNYPYEHDQFLSAMGACWAVMALSRALGPPRPVEMPALREELPVIEPWVETILFGNAGDLRHLLDNGFNPNSAMKSGMTALMMAAPDVAKMTLLLDRGADVNAHRQDSGYSALFMASLYADSAPAVRLLLSRGAAPEHGEAFGKAYPLALASLAGNAESLKLLHEAGEAVDDIFDYAGLSSAAPLLLMVPTADMSVARALLDGGASVDRPDPEGLTALHWAALGNRLDLAQLLIARGADVNRADTHGMTPMLYAASIDFGDSAMIDLLLKSGAHAEARTPDGLTAVDLARKYQHTHLPH